MTVDTNRKIYRILSLQLYWTQTIGLRLLDSDYYICGCPIWDSLCVSAPVYRPVQGPIARPPGFLPAPHIGLVQVSVV
jgi:hypothetical protein